jgi:dGTPase
LDPKRKKNEDSKSLRESFISDKNRIIYSGPFRRLQQKAQVFSLETNATVRSRLTHTLEVATVGISLAEKISDILVKRNIMDKDCELPFIKIVENTCLLHDIGNPPFGHFAEAAIKKWFGLNWERYYQRSTGNISVRWEQSTIIKTLISDFLQFDGNPQGIRIISKLQDVPDDHQDYGLNLTYSQVFAMLKYLASPSEVRSNNHLFKKAGYFHSEAKKIQEIKEFFGFDKRFPLTYIMEAADDIAYSLSDIEDGIEKRVITASEFFERLLEEWGLLGETGDFPFGNLIDYNLINNKRSKHAFFLFKIKFTRELIKHAVDRYTENHDKILNGEIEELICKNSDEGKALKSITNVTRKYLFRSREAEDIELAGHKIIYGILDAYKPLFTLDSNRFYSLVESIKDVNKQQKGLDMEWRLFNRLPGRYVDAYTYDYKAKWDECQGTGKMEEFYQYEWFYRAHLIVDYISGMTDNYALETYRLLYGISI